MPTNSIFSGPITHLLSMLRVLMTILSMPVQKKKKKKTKGLKAVRYRFCTSLVVLKCHHGSERVNKQTDRKSEIERCVIYAGATRWWRFVRTQELCGSRIILPGICSFNRVLPCQFYSRDAVRKIWCKVHYKDGRIYARKQSLWRPVCCSSTTVAVIAVGASFCENFWPW